MHETTSPLVLFSAIAALTGGLALGDDMASTPPVPDDDTLLRVAAVFGDIKIDRLNVFETSDETDSEKKGLPGLANSLHPLTREGVIRKQLLFNPGDRFSRQLIEETERTLRANRYIYDADIDLVRFADGRVDVVVVTQDVWTLTGSASASRSGGSNRGSIAVKEMNLLGTGIGLELSRRTNVDRSSTTFKVFDDHIAGTHVRGLASHAASSDGRTQNFVLALPFYALASKRAAGFSYLDYDRIDSIYDLGEIVDGYSQRERIAEVFAGWSRGLDAGWVTRYQAGIAFEDHIYAEDIESTGVVGVPQSWRATYPFLGIEIFEDRFEEATNVNQIARTEDLFLGTRLAAKLGYAAGAFGNDDPAWLGTAELSKGYGSTDSKALLLNSALAGRFVDGHASNLAVSTAAKWFWRQSEKKLFVASLAGDFGSRLDPHNEFVLGGDNGLRGYPLRYMRGNRRALLTLEQRIFTDFQLFRLADVGAAAFLDIGRAWGSAGAADPGWLSNAGVGLRLGNRRSAAGRVVHIDLAFPLSRANDVDRVQLLVGTKKEF